MLRRTLHRTRGRFIRTGREEMPARGMCGPSRTTSACPIPSWERILAPQQSTSRQPPSGTTFQQTTSTRYPFPFYQAGHHVDYRNSGGTVQQSAPQSAFYSISSVCSAGDQCPAWRTNNTYVINDSSGTARYYQTIWNGTQTTTSDAGTSNVTVGV